MKILELPAYFLPHVGGIESVVYSLSRIWAKDNYVKIITSDIGCKRRWEAMDGVLVKRVPSFKFLLDAIAPTLFLNLEKADIAHIHHPHPFWMYVCSVYCRLRKIPYVLHMHGREIVYPGLMNIPAQLYNFVFLNSIMKHASRIMTHTTKVIALSKYMQKYPQKIVCIPHGTEMRRLGPVKRENFILTVGVRDYKRIDLLIGSLPKVLAKVKTRLVVVGDGSELRKLKALAEKLGMSPHVEFLGYVSESEKFKLYQRAGVFVLPSPTIMESFGTVAFEALSAKCPAIVTSGAGVSEVFTNEGIGVVVQPYELDEMASQIINILTNKRLAKKIGEKGYKIVSEKYQWKDIAQRYLDVFNEVIHGNKARK